ncbi:hypothetical protein G7A72_12240 [Flavobacterium sp. Sr18]|uniref:hypothetical protein n=1 Tax=Flavobacterium sp. Sr18 TaxID=935222 RepID=UPI0013E4CC8B|nr:hypothetical protein [Flavobacterium sp. Sr18]QIH39537.1 hypothetical protein G7A72_12240 [Flavobacterium sp. Sr18]
MDHKLKTILFRMLALLPNKVDDFFYHKIQGFFEKSTLDDRLKSVEYTCLRLSKVLHKLNIDVKDKTVFEFGSGWFPSMPYFFKYNYEAKEVLTYDINKHFKKDTVLELNQIFSKKYNCTIIPESGNRFGLPSGIEYFPNYNIIAEDIPSADIVFSRYVLSHMRENDVISLHKKMKMELKKGTTVIHFISPSDLRQHGDNTISLQEFLKYSTLEWDKIHTKFDYHNRLRLPQFLEIFTTCGLEVVHLEYESTKSGTKLYDLFKKVKLHADYMRYSDEQLTAGNILVVLKI